MDNQGAVSVLFLTVLPGHYGILLNKIYGYIYIPAVEGEVADYKEHHNSILYGEDHTSFDGTAIEMAWIPSPHGALLYACQSRCLGR